MPKPAREDGRHRSDLGIEDWRFGRDQSQAGHGKTTDLTVESRETIVGYWPLS